MRGREIAELCEALSQERRTAVADFARLLLARQDNERWEAVIDDPKTLPRLETFLRESSLEEDGPLDLREL